MLPSDQDWPRCACGCGEPVPARKANCTARGYVKGEPCKFIAGHSARARIKRPVGGRLRCPRCSESKPTAEFNRDSNRPSGFDPWCRVCQKAAYRRRKPVSKYRRWASNDIRNRANAAARRARLRNAFVEAVDPLEVFVRDAGVCGICDAPVVGDYTIDHITPLARGGEHSYANVQLAHPSCNFSKKDRMPCLKSAPQAKALD